MSTYRGAGHKEGVEIPAVKLTTAYSDSIKPTPGRQASYPDKEVRGLELRVSGDGRKVWCFRYRTKTERRQGWLTLGLYTKEFGLSEARTEARKAQVAVDGGSDPAREARLAREAALAEPIVTFDDLAQAYFSATKAGRLRPKRANSIANEEAVYGVHIKKNLGARQLEDVSRRAIRAWKPYGSPGCAHTTG